MLSPKDQLTELVRDLENQNHIFSTDPLLVTEKMADENASPLDKFHRRAERIDSNGKLTRTLRKIDTRIKFIILMLSVLWCVSGFMGLFALLRANVVNFFYVLVCLLGFHTIMLLGWMVFTLVSPKNKPTMFASLVSPHHLIRGKDTITQSAVHLYERQLEHAGMRWYLGKISHQLWIATLAGMLLSLVFLLMVRDFAFSWESTLLSGQTIAQIVTWLSWLPSMVGFPTPSPEQIMQSQQFAQNTASVSSNATGVSSFEWAMLLIGSLLMYGIVPRVLVWVFCIVLFRSKKMTVDITLPYYQKILADWSSSITDKDDFKEEINPTAHKVEISSGAKLAVLLEHQSKDKEWYLKVDSADNNLVDHNDDKNFTIFGVLDDRDDVDRLINYLNNHPVQVLMGINMKSLPDRGTMRKLDKIVKNAEFGLIIKLLEDDTTQSKENYQKRKAQWVNALQERNIGIL